MDRTESDQYWMRKAIALAHLSEGGTRPNPPVGAVVVKGNRLIGEGRHRVAGGPHAEVDAFNQCAESAEGATIYVTLEPCCTTGKTPPCTDRIIREKVARVVVACTDQNAKHAGKGFDILRQAGIEVTEPVCQNEAISLVRPFFKHITTGMPYVTLKLGMTLDGKIADRIHHSQWITSPSSRGVAQEFRRRADVMLVGSGTVSADNPSLLYRGETPGGEKLLRVVIDSKANVPSSAKIFQDNAAARTILATSDSVAEEQTRAYTEKGASVWRFAPDAQGHLSLWEVLSRLGKELGVLHVLCEGGGKLAGALHDQGLVDEYALFYAPKIMGDPQAISGFAGGKTLLPEVSPLHLLSVERIGDDLLARYLRKAD